MKYKRNDLNAEYVRKIIDYNPKTGVFTWHHRADRSNRWNTKYANKKAGWIDKRGYCFIGINEKIYKASRLAWLHVKGEWPKCDIDHRNQKKSDTSWKNLREATDSQNQHNKKRQKNNTSGYKGIVWIKSMKRWRGQAKLKGKYFYFGYFTNKKSARKAYIEGIRLLHQEFACAG